jgi:hypothetical protein
MAESSPAIEEFEALLATLKGRHANWREASADWALKAPGYLVTSMPLPYYIWAVESGEFDTDPGGADDPADQVYFAYREGLIKIGFSGSPRKTSELCLHHHQDHLRRKPAGGDAPPPLC